MKKKIAMLIIVILLISNIYIPVAYAQDQQIRDPRELYNLGEAIAINVKSYEPAVLTSNMLDDVASTPVYAFLEGYTLGSFLGDKRPAIEPLYGDPAIRSISVRVVNTSRFVRGVRYIRPGNRQISLSDLGTLAIDVGRQTKESELPGNEDFTLFGDTGGINIDLMARIEFYTERLVDFGEESLLLKENKNENDWRSLQLDDYSFWGRRGYIRPGKITGDSATFDLYDGSLRPIIRGKTLRVGETSQPFIIGDYGRELLENRYRVRLDGVVEPGVRTAKVKLTIDGETIGYKILKQGQILYPGSQWTVKSIERETVNGRTVERLILRNRNGEESEVKREYAGQVIATGEDPCSSLIDDTYCKAIAELAKVETYKDISDEDNIPYNIKSSYFIAKSYESISDTQANNPRIAADARQKAIEYYKKVSDYNKNIKDEKLMFNNVDVDRRLDELAKKTAGNILGGEAVIVEGNAELYERNIQLSLISIDTGQDVTSQKPIAVLEINGGLNTGTLEEGGLLTNVEETDYKGRYKWLLTDVFDDRIRVTKSYTGAAATVPGTGYGPGVDKNNKLSRYEPVISNVAQKYNVDPNLIKAVIWRESDKDSNGIPMVDSYRKEPNGKESFGLMQVLCSDKPGVTLTAESLGFTGNCENLYQPELGIEYGTKYLKQQLDRFGDYQLALAAYNGGPGQVSNHCGTTYSTCSDWDDARVPVYVIAVSGYKSEFDSAVGIIAGGLETREIVTGRTEILDLSHSVKLVRVDLKKYALFTIIPGTGAPLYSESTFSVHIPIEKRAIELTPKRIDKELNKTKERLEKLDSTIASLEDLVKKWKALCLITFAYLTLKNSFFSGLSRSKAREQVMKEDQVTVDGKTYNGWNAYCASSEAKNYGGFDHCINENSARITDDINNAETNIAKVNQELSSIKDITKTTDQAALASKNGMTQEQVGTLVKYNKLSAEEARRLTYLKASGKTEEYNKQLAQLKIDADRFIAYENVANSKIGQYNGLLDPDKRKWEQLVSTLDQGVIKGSIEKQELIPFLQEKYSDVDIKNGKQVNNAWIDTAGYYTFDEAGNDVVLEPVKRGELNVDYEGKQLFVGVAKGSTQRQLFFVESTGELRTTFAVKPAIEYNEDYTPYIIPLNPKTCGNGNANYVEIKSQNGRPVEYKVFNVGSNGLIDPNSKDGVDQLLYSDVQLRNRPENLKLLQCVERAYSAASGTGKYRQGDRVKISATEEYAASFQAAELKKRLSNPKCSDVMDPRDCKILYNICDPVMCPVSRFNLGGRWQLPAGTSVAQTGIIGSIILGLPNWQFYPGNEGKGENIIPPVCMTGVLAGLKGLRGVLQGYEQCLVAAKVNGESIGICDRIRSIYACEILWREALAIFKVHGSLVGLLSRGLGETAGGGEYLTLESSVTNAANSVEFFSREYATSAFAAYQSRSTDEIGSQICKAAIYGEFPGIGNVLDELSRPEDPPQFTAILSTMPYSSTLHQSRYNIFYYIYAGNDIIGVTRGPLKYSVFLYNPSTNKRFYATERCDRPTGIIKRGESATFSVDCPADDGFTQVCVDLAGRLQCGFGKVSSDFALNYVNDLVVANEAKKQINSEEQCRPDDPRYGSSFAGLIAGNPGVLNSGVQRFCSVQNPGAGTKTYGDWMRIGDCGKDKEGRALGSCWMDTKSYSIKDTTLAKDVNNELQQRGFDTAAAEDSKMMLDAAYNSYKEKKITVSKDGRIKENEKTIEDASFNGLLDEFINLLTHFDDKVRANAQFMIGMIFYDKASRTSLKEQTEEQKQEAATFSPSIPFNQPEQDKPVCKINDAYWSKDGRRIVTGKELVGGETVDMIVEGNHCIGEYVLVVYENNQPFDPQFIERKTAFFDGTRLQSSWTTKWQSDWVLGNPEYYFEVNRNTIAPEVPFISANEIVVIRG